MKPRGPAELQRRRVEAKKYREKHATTEHARTARWREANKEKIREAERQRDRPDYYKRRNELRKEHNDRLTDQAVNRGKAWTGPELELASRPDLTSAEVAAILHRTYYAVANMRNRLRDDADGRMRQLRDGPQPPTSVSSPLPALLASR